MRSLLRLQIAPVLVVCWLLWFNFSSQDATMTELGGSPDAQVTAPHPRDPPQLGHGNESPAVSAAPQHEWQQSTEREVISSGVRPELSEWHAFRLAHSHLAQATEASFLWLLNFPTTIQDIAASCAGPEFGWALSRIVLAANIVIQHRDIFVENVECGGNGESDDATPLRDFCDCFLAGTPQITHMVVPDEVPDRDLASYRGHLALGNWHVN